MRICIVQKKIEWANPTLNRTEIEHFINDYLENQKEKCSEEIDLIVLPEMFSTGFCPNPQNLAEEKKGSSIYPSVQWMREIAKRYDCAVCGSIAIKENISYYNRLFFVYPDGEFKFYDKRHLFSYSGEDKNFTAGENQVVVDYKGFKLLLQICYDLRFPIFSRNKIIPKNSLTDSQETYLYDAIIYVAAWPQSRIAAWDKLLLARAIENCCYVVGVNCVGEMKQQELGDKKIFYSGNSTIVDYIGNSIISCNSDGKEEIQMGCIDLESLNIFRKNFPVLKDSDSFKL